MASHYQKTIIWIFTVMKNSNLKELFFTGKDDKAEQCVCGFKFDYVKEVIIR